MNYRGTIRNLKNKSKKKQERGEYENRKLYKIK